LLFFYGDYYLTFLFFFFCNYRFEATDVDLDEVVLMMLVRILRDTLESPMGSELTDDIVFEMFQTCFKMAIQVRLSG